MKSVPKCASFFVVNDSKVPFDFLKGYYQTGLLAVLSRELSIDEICTCLGIALLAVSREQKFRSEVDLRNRLFDLVFAELKLTDINFERNGRAILSKIYDYFWGFSKEAKRAIAFLASVEYYPGLLDRLDSYRKRLTTQRDAITAEAVDIMYWIVNRHYQELHLNKMQSRNHLHNF